MPAPDMRRPGAFTLLAVVAAVLALVPVLLVPIPGFVDFPAHMARHHILANAPLGGPLSRHFVVHWQWIGNLGEDIPAAWLARWLGGEMATRIVTAAIAPLTIVGIVALSRAAHGRIAASAMLALPLALNHAWAFGFLNYCLGIALALLAGAWLFARKRETPWELAALGGIGLVVWTAHMASWAVLVLLAAGNELGTLRRSRDIWPAIRRNLPLLLPLIPLLLWRSHAAGSDFAFVYGNALGTKARVFASALRGTGMILDIGLLVALVIGAVLALRWAGRRQIEPRLFAAALLLTLATIAAPQYLLNSWGTDIRTAPIAILLLVLSITPARDPRRERLVCAIGLSLFLVRLTSVTWTWAQHSPLLEQRLTLLDAVPRGGRLGYLYVRPSCDIWSLRPDEKLASYAVSRRDAFVNTLFMVDNARLITMRDPHLQARWSSDSQIVYRICPADEPDLADLKAQLETMRSDRFDAIWVSGVGGERMPIVPGYAVARSLPGETMLIRR